MKTEKPTMEDVARMAGVSAATVARVIYANGYVKASTRETVEAAVAKTGYRPNIFARGLRTKRSSTLGMVVSETDQNPFFSKVAHVVQLEALKHGYTVFMLNHNWNAGAERAGVQRFLDQHVAAIIFCAAMEPANVRFAAKADIPVIQVERELASTGCMALIDSRPGMNEALQHLYNLGHRRIAYIGGQPEPARSEIPAEKTNEGLRLQAYKDGLTALGLSVRQLQIQLGPYYPTVEGAPLEGFTRMKRLLREKNPPTAVVTGSDIFAAGVLQAVHEAGLRVPDDVSVIGFDDSISTLATPPLTTIAQPYADLGRAAIELTVQAIDDTKLRHKVVTFPTHLVTRKSTGAASR
jgi:DNA-binding LacI/PurR family transcriptional regulator